MVGLSDKVLKRQVFQSCNDIRDIDSLRVMCSAFEAARDDALCNRAWLSSFPRAAAAEVCEEEPEVAAALNKYDKSAPMKVQSRPCGNCGIRHASGYSSCPARNTTCHGCGKTGHLKKCCRGRSAKKNVSGLAEESDIVSAVTAVVVAAEARLRNGPSPQPTIRVDVCMANSTEWSGVRAVPDAGAQVCVAGPTVLATLNVKPAVLRLKGGLRDFANLHLKCLGSTLCTIEYKGRHTTQEVYFVKSSIDFYLSMDACKKLGLVPETFPNHAPFSDSAPTAASATHTSVEATDQSARPSTIPFSPTEENITRLEDWLLAHFSSTTFNTEREPLPVMEGKPHRIHLLPNAVPYACHTPASVPKHWEKEVKAQLEEDIKRGVLQRAPSGEPTEWCSRMVVVAKKSGQPRRTVDYQKLNASCRRETHHTPTPFDMVSSIPLCSYKTVADAYWGFHQVELDKESIPLTTFITPWGRYQYRRTPMGHCSASDAYTRRFDDAIEEVPRKFKCVDDTLLYDSSVEGAFWYVYDFLAVCASKGITLKPEKFKFCKKEVEFVGFDVAPIMTHFRDLLKKPSGKQVYWDEHLQERFSQVQNTVCKLAKDGLTYYDKLRPTVAVTDWSKEGVGFVILQQYCKRNHAADFLSRFPALRTAPDRQDESFNEELMIAMVSAITENLQEQCTIDENIVEEAALDDPAYQLLVARVTAGDWNPKKSREIACLRPFYSVRERLSTSGNLVTYCFNDSCIRLVIPEGLRHQVAANLHAGHQGLDTMLRRARHSVYWPGIEGDLQHHRSQCTSCDVHSPSLPAEVLRMTPAPEYPFQQTVMDLFQLAGHTYMAYCDRLTGWLEIAHFPNGTSSAKVMTKLRNYFTRWGAPEQLSSERRNDGFL
ncbi:uncharacterized protein [Macrobrachium rosenbergii]|uniref:uncharacterized protein n=1 Tax=Macrobrachium rosenbergii TaxID=79674 RepID=UPI0034D49C71